MRLKPLGGRTRTAISPRARPPRSACAGQVSQMPPKAAHKEQLCLRNAKSIPPRANGAKSHGPVTEEGRKKSSMNALKHGLTARTVLFSNDNHAEYDALLESYIQSLQPIDPVEMDLVVEMVNAKWQQHRVH